MGVAGIGTGFRKRAASKRAREERAAAVDRRLRALQTKGKPDADPRSKSLLTPISPDSTSRFDAREFTA